MRHTIINDKRSLDKFIGEHRSEPISIRSAAIHMGRNEDADPVCNEATVRAFLKVAADFTEYRSLASSVLPLERASMVPKIAAEPATLCVRENQGEVLADYLRTFLSHNQNEPNNGAEVGTHATFWFELLKETARTKEPLTLLLTEQQTLILISAQQKRYKIPAKSTDFAQAVRTARLLHLLKYKGWSGLMISTEDDSTEQYLKGIYAKPNTLGEYAEYLVIQGGGSIKYDLNALTTATPNPHTILSGAWNDVRKVLCVMQTLNTQAVDNLFLPDFDGLAGEL